MEFKNFYSLTFIYRDYVGFDEEIASRCLEFMQNNSQCEVMAPLIRNQSREIIHNYRNFPTLIDFVIKNVSCLRKRFASRMRRFLMWDIKMDQKSRVDFVTSDFMCVRTEFLEEFGLNRLDDDFFDLQICLFAWSKGKQVIFNPLIQLISLRNKTQKSLLRKSKLLWSAIWMKLRCFRQFASSEYPSKEYVQKKELLLAAHKMNSRSFLRSVGAVFQKNNTVVQVYEGEIEGDFSYKQPLVFHYDGVLAVLKSAQNKYGLIKIWRHAPIKQNVPNLFPVFPDTQDLGIYSYECVRGGAEKSDSQMVQSILRELKEEINLDSKEIVDIVQGSRLVANTAWDVSNMHVFIVTVGEIRNIKLQESESIVDFDFYSKDQILDMINKNKIICALTRAALLEDILAND